MNPFPVTVVIPGAMALMLISTVTPVEAQAFRLAIDEISVTTPTDGDGEDDVYFTVVGATSSLGTRTIINIPEIGPAPPESFYRMGGARGQGVAVRRSLPLWSGEWFCCLDRGEHAFFVVFVRERDSARPSEMATHLDWAARWLATNDHGWPTIASLLYGDLLEDRDDTIGAFLVDLTLQGNAISTAWTALSPYDWDRVGIRGNTTLVAQSHAAAEFLAPFNEPHRSKRWDYRFRASVQQLVMSTNLNSEKCLDVANASLQAGANVQQYECSSDYHFWADPNQQWVLSPVSVSNAPVFYLQAVHSGQCLDVAWASRADGANVQQHDCHFGANQQWRVTLRQSANYDVGWEFRSVNSNKCLDVAGGSFADAANVQQFTCHFGAAQLWRLSGHRPFRGRPEVTPR